ncbi:UNVERIFIED_CONTAM: hypothetical protein GTU68_037399 [Idotea baltica]|nr:hypothetical protein [Idotea baltica]
MPFRLPTKCYIFFITFFIKYLGLQLLCDLSGGKLEGGVMDSLDVSLIPKKISGGSFAADTKTAGSVSLLIQSVLPCALFGEQPSKFVLRGGTNAEMAPQIDYTLEVFRKICLKFGIQFDLSLETRGFFPVGKGEVTLTVPPLKGCIKPVELIKRGDIVEIKGVSFVAGVLPIKVAHVMSQVATKTLRDKLGSKPKISISAFKETKAVGNGSCLVLWAETSTGCVFGASGLGKRGVPAEDVGKRTAEDMLQTIFSKGCVDSFLQDQIIILMALADGKSRIRTTELTLHSQTAIHVAELMTDAKFKTVEEKESATIILECEGIGLKL